ncbi:tetraprenyl-beta-curcumene synthase family protein [Paenibacillus crassostreae]|uniref:tetraprenyl-beta-curcumene synthase family protein n=1 Tax=Paenibacillus crassostreae TaxID=1763538 RepID=UPI000AE7B1AA
MSNHEQRLNQVPRNPLSLMGRVYKHILPEVRAELSGWRKLAAEIPDPELRMQALASINTKQFHCQGGAVYAAIHQPERSVLIRLIVSYQTISDYLDNLCDRSTSMDPADFKLLHQSMLDAIDPRAEQQNYYALHQEVDDGGYLYKLVETCQSCIVMLPAYSVVQPYISDLACLYTDLQVYKHIDPERREVELLNWWSKQKHRAPQLEWQEFAAATGSTLAIFMLFLAASNVGLSDNDAASIHKAYFPHLCCLHILLDYLIDQEEDRLGGDLNFCNYYSDSETMLRRIIMIADSARNDVKLIPATPFHRMIIEGLLAIYLSDPKVSVQQEVVSASKRLMKGSPLSRIFFFMNSQWIRKYLYK